MVISIRGLQHSGFFLYIFTRAGAIAVGRYTKAVSIMLRMPFTVTLSTCPVPGVRTAVLLISCEMRKKSYCRRLRPLSRLRCNLWQKRRFI